MKCIYNNLENRKLFKCPDFAGKKVEANFEHIVYKAEVGSVKLADALFHRSNIEGLKVYGEKKHYPDFLQTAQFLVIIRDWWDSFNVKAPNIGFKKRDPNREPITVET